MRSSKKGSGHVRFCPFYLGSVMERTRKGVGAKDVLGEVGAGLVGLKAALEELSSSSPSSYDASRLALLARLARELGLRVTSLVCRPLDPDTALDIRYAANKLRTAVQRQMERCKNPGGRERRRKVGEGSWDEVGLLLKEISTSKERYLTPEPLVWSRIEPSFEKEEVCECGKCSREAFDEGTDYVSNPRPKSRRTEKRLRPSKELRPKKQRLLLEQQNRDVQGQDRDRQEQKQSRCCRESRPKKRNRNATLRSTGWTLSAGQDGGEIGSQELDPEEEDRSLEHSSEQSGGEQGLLTAQHERYCAQQEHHNAVKELSLIAQELDLARKRLSAGEQFCAEREPMEGQHVVEHERYFTVQDQYSPERERFYAESAQYPAQRERLRAGPVRYAAQEEFYAGLGQYAAQQERFCAEPEQYTPPQEQFCAEPDEHTPPQEQFCTEPEQYNPHEEQFCTEPEHYIPPQVQFCTEPEQYNPHEEQFCTEPEQYIPPQVQFRTEPEQYTTRQEQFRPGPEQFCSEHYSPNRNLYDSEQEQQNKNLNYTIESEEWSDRNVGKRGKARWGQDVLQNNWLKVLNPSPRDRGGHKGVIELKEKSLQFPSLEEIELNSSRLRELDELKAIVLSLSEKLSEGAKALSAFHSRPREEYETAVIEKPSSEKLQEGTSVATVEIRSVHAFDQPRDQDCDLDSSTLVPQNSASVHTLGTTDEASVKSCEEKNTSEKFEASGERKIRETPVEKSATLETDFPKVRFQSEVLITGPAPPQACATPTTVLITPQNTKYKTIGDTCGMCFIPEKTKNSKTKEL